MQTKVTLYKRTSNGAAQQWTIVQEGDQYYTIEGQVDGKMTQSTPTVAKPKNVGKKSETSGAVQAALEANAKIKLKLDKGYVYDLAEIDTADTFEPMLAKKYKECFKKIKFPCAVQPKFDGVRSNVDKKKGQLSREGRPQVSSPHILQYMQNILTDNVVFDGELYNHKLKENFNEIISLARASKPTAEDLKASADMLEYHIYDIFLKDEPDMLFFDRIKLLEQKLQYQHPCLVFCETIICNNEAELDAAYERFLSEGYEGMMVRNNMPYQQKRTDHLLKRKEFQDAEFEILDIIEGDGNRSGMMGRIVLKISDTVTCKSSALGNQAHFTELLVNKDKYIGKMATVKFQNYTPDGSLRFPTIKAIRGYE